MLLSTMDICDDERHWCSTLVFDPVRSRAEFGKYLAGTKLLRRSIVMVIGEDPGEQVDDRGVALMAVQTDMAAWRHDRAAQTQFAIFGAKAFGFKVAWIRRSGGSDPATMLGMLRGRAEEIGHAPDHVVSALSELPKLL